MYRYSENPGHRTAGGPAPTMGAAPADSSVSHPCRIPVATLLVLTLGIGCTAVLALRVGASAVYGPRVSALAGMWWPQPPRLSAFRLIDQDGHALTAGDLRGQWTLLSFGYTHCPDVCPATLALIDRAYEALGDDEAARDLSVLFVSVDARRDRPDVLARYVRHFDARFRAATAPMEALHLLTRQLGADFTKIAGEVAGEYGYEHSASIFLIAPDLRVVGELMPPLEAEALATRVRSIRRFIEAQG